MEYTTFCAYRLATSSGMPDPFTETDSVIGSAYETVLAVLFGSNGFAYLSSFSLASIQSTG